MALAAPLGLRAGASTRHELSSVGVWERGGVGRVETCDEAIDLLTGPGDLGEPAGERLNLCPEVPYFLDRDAGVDKRAP